MPSGTPTDTYHFVLLTLWIVGVGTLFPWNAFISAPDYFSNFHEYVDPNATLTHTEHKAWENILTYFTTSFSVCNIVGQVVVLRKGVEWSVSLRVELSILAMCVVMVIVPILSYLTMDAQFCFFLLVGFAGLCGFFTAFFQSTIFGLGAMFPDIFTQAVMVGNSSAGLAVSLLRVATKASGGSDKTSGSIYMYLSAGWLLFSLGCFLFLRRLRFAQKHVDEFTSFERFHLDGESVTTAGPTAVPPIANQYSQAGTVAHSHSVDDFKKIAEIERDLHEAEQAALQVQRGNGKDRHLGVTNATPVYDAPKEEDLLLAPKEGASVWGVMKEIYPMAVSVWLTLFVSIAVFPGVVSRIPSPLEDGWFTIWMILLYNFGDNLGRILPKWIKPSRSIVVIVSILRLAFVPALILCVSVITHWIWPLIFVTGM